MAEYLGVDYAARNDQVYPAFKAAGVGFVVRYLCPTRYPKLLTRDEAEALSRAGLNIVSVWQDTANRADWFTAQRGAAEGASALAAAEAVGQPAGTPIYFAVDFDAQPEHLPAIKAYLEAVKVGLQGAYPAGLYGGYRVVEAFADEVFWLWQTYAWSAGRLHPKADLYQYQNGFLLGGATVDLDKALGDPGWWRIGGPVAPPPFKDPREELIRLPLLRLGASGAAVAVLQVLLQVAGVATSVVTDGVFGPQTEASVRAFQQHATLDADGIVGPFTWAALSKLQPLSPAAVTELRAQVGAWADSAAASLERLKTAING